MNRPRTRARLPVSKSRALTLEGLVARLAALITSAQRDSLLLGCYVPADAPRAEDGRTDPNPTACQISSVQFGLSGCVLSPGVPGNSEAPPRTRADVKAQESLGQGRGRGRWASETPVSLPNCDGDSGLTRDTADQYNDRNRIAGLNATGDLCVYLNEARHLSEGTTGILRLD